MLFFLSILLIQKSRKLKAYLEERERIIDISSKLIDHPIIIVTDEYEVIFINKSMFEYIQTQKGDSIQNILSLPLVTIDKEEKSFIDLLSSYDQKAVNNSLVITDVTIIANGKKKSVTLRVSKSISPNNTSHIGFAIFDMTGKLAMLQRYYLSTSTGLPNHNKAIADIGLMANKALSNHKNFAVALLSIDNFLEIITTIGYKESLNITLHIAKLLQTISTKNQFQLYHMTGNNFLLVLSNIQTTQKCIDLVNQYTNECEDLLHHKESNIHFTISAGISIYPDNDAHTLISSAYEALRLSKQQGLGYTSVATPDRNAITKKQQSVMYAEIKQALEAEQFTVYFQPVYDVEHQSIRGAEALIRWVHPDKGIIPPGQFLPLVEDTGFMKYLSAFVIDKTIKQISTWNTLGFQKIQVAINLSMREFSTEDFQQLLVDALEKYNVPTSQLKVEITENIAMANEQHTLTQFSKLKKLGIEISLDDFGTGYSSFTILESFPIDTLKIDKSFVTDMKANKDHLNIVKAMIAMAHTLQLKVVAEGVEDEKTANLLQEIGCDYLQGYYYAKPIPAFEFQELIRSHKQTSDNADIIIME
jgi:diguanylate cyclase (GGDEF)-like protein